MVLPILAMWNGRRELGVHWDNIKQAWLWGRDDFKWMALMPLAVLSSKIKLPEQGKFNAAEKVNFMVLMATYPLYILTGLLIWFKTYGLLAWALHFLMALIATPLIFGHMYMAMIDRGGRPGLQGMLSGFVGREWAKHHYPLWYRKHFEPEEEPAPEEQDQEACLAAACEPGRER
jgi:formate dehydrogenase subunit gamma